MTATRVCPHRSVNGCDVVLHRDQTRATIVFDDAEVAKFRIHPSGQVDAYYLIPMSRLHRRRLIDAAREMVIGRDASRVGGR